MKEELYRKMYARLCIAVSEAIDLLQESGKDLHVSEYLKKALWDAEELYLQYYEKQDPSSLEI